MMRELSRRTWYEHVSRKRSAFYSALEYAVGLDLFEANPIDKVQYRKRENTNVVDRHVVANPQQARAFLKAVREIHPASEAFFGCLYFAGLRPSEAKHLRHTDCTLPEKGWRELLLTGSTHHAGADWTDSGEASEDLSLKHRPDKATVWAKARAKALGETQAATPLARRPYDLRHAAVSLWLNAGVPAAQVAEWAGHSVNVLKVYAKCTDGQDEIARRRVEAALRDAPDELAA